MQRFQIPWITMSVILLVVYLGFFHFCIGSSYTECVVAGIAGWVLWTGICYFFRSVYLNRFEYLIHQFVGVDILLEGFSPLHEGFGFYYCALCFWMVFVCYQSMGAGSLNGIQLRAETTDPGLAQ